MAILFKNTQLNLIQKKMSGASITGHVTRAKIGRLRKQASAMKLHLVTLHQGTHNQFM